MTDLSQTIAPKSDQLNADDLIGRTMTVRVTRVSRSESPEQPIAINFDGDNGKPYKPCKSMRRVLVQVWGKDGAQYVGKSMTLYRDDAVKFGGMDVGGIRISHMSGIDKAVTMALTASKANRKPFTVKPLSVQDATPPQISPEVKKAGDAAAAKGVDAYKEWLASLDPKTKETVKPYHKGWSDVAKAVVMPEEIPLDMPVDVSVTDEEDDDRPAI